jgi:hypothetical protein
METNELLKAYKRYVLHKKKIISNSRNYKSLRVLSSLDKCLMMAAVLKSYKPIGVAGAIVRLEADLRNILPHANNRSFSSSKEELTHLLNKSKQFIYEKRRSNINT